MKKKKYGNYQLKSTPCPFKAITSNTTPPKNNKKQHTQKTKKPNNNKNPQTNR